MQNNTNSKKKNFDISIEIPDLVLRKKLTKILDLESETDITPKLLSKLTSLDLSIKNINEDKILNIKGLEYCYNLKTLWINQNEISDLTPLKNVYLESLWAHNNEIFFCAEFFYEKLRHLESELLEDFSMWIDGNPISLEGYELINKLNCNYNSSIWSDGIKNSTISEGYFYKIEKNIIEKTQIKLSRRIKLISILFLLCVLIKYFIF